MKPAGAVTATRPSGSGRVDVFVTVKARRTEPAFGTAGGVVAVSGELTVVVNCTTGV